MKRLLFLFALVLSGAAYAVTCTQWADTFSSDGNPVLYFDTHALACESYTTRNNAWSGRSYNFTMTSSSETNCAYGAYNKTTGAFVANSNRALTTRTGDYCDAGCEAGTVAVKNITIGYAGRDYDANSEVPNGGLDYLPNGSRNTAGTYPVIPASVCLGSCLWNVGAATGEFWASRQPTGAGMYRMSADYTLTSTAGSCTPTTADKDLVDGLLAAPSACPGAQGYINGRPACVPKDNVESPKALPQDKPHKEGNPKAGSGPSETDRIPPVNGDGGNKGGPPHPRDGVVVTPSGTTLSPTSTGTPTGTKTAVAGEEQLACGAPGQPPCKIDESGTPTTKTLALDEAAIGAAATANRGTIGGTGDKGMFGSWTGVFVTPPVVACEPVTFNMVLGQTVASDPCPVVEGTRSVVGWLWALSGFWLCLGWIRESV